MVYISPRLRKATGMQYLRYLRQVPLNLPVGIIPAGKGTCNHNTLRVEVSDPVLAGNLPYSDHNLPEIAEVASTCDTIIMNLQPLPNSFLTCAFPRLTMAQHVTNRERTPYNITVKH